MQNKRIVFMGTPEIAINYLQILIDNNYNIIASYTQPPRRKDRGMKLEKSSIHKLSMKNNIPVFHPDNLRVQKVYEELNNLNPDIIIVMGYGMLIPSNILNMPKFGCINIHVSLLPRWRGASPIEYTILNGDLKTGVTIFKIEKKIDTGPILASEHVNINNDINKDELTNKINILGSKLLIKTLPKIFKNKIKMLKQNENQATYSKKITSSIRKINFNNDVNVVYNHIRAFAPKPSSWFILNNERIKIIKCTMEICKSESSTILNHQLHIGCKNGKIIPLIVQREGKKIMNIKDFLKGFAFDINKKINE